MPVPRIPVPRLPRDFRSRPWPLVTEEHAGTATVTFLCESRQATSVLLFANRLTDERNIGCSEMEYLGDGLWGLSYRMETDWRASYGFLQHTGCGVPPWRDDSDQRSLRALLDTGNTDPRNPLTCPNSTGRLFSVVELSDAPPQPFRLVQHQDDGVPTPSEHRIPTSSGPRTVWAHPVGSPGEGSPLVLVLDGDTWLHHHRMQLSLNAAHQAGVIPASWVLFVSSGSKAQRWQYLGHRDGASAELATGILPWAQHQLGAGLGPASTLATGHSLGGISALWALARHPERIGAALAQSPSLWTDQDSALASVLRQCVGRIRLEVGRQEWAMVGQVRQLAQTLQDAYVAVEYVEFNGGHDYACWRGGLIEGIAALLPPE
ncbi:enterochelin esterase domain-containing protein [Nesterenkonia ebinurensis]|uniref:enterochelin esterase domain-containing protein n=1 Tax=Nesterenkonia ebinurensis TaxID=2608252 RepID=UPI00123D65CC|nr:alpha/beta hydrolase-fold protein [Nesterenkonia ebinurensis]